MSETAADTDEKIILTPEQALSMLGDGDSIHTFRQAGPALVGCDWSRNKIEEAIRNNRCEIGGAGCKNFNHGLVIDVDGWLFVECREGFDYAAFEAGIVAAN